MEYLLADDYELFIYTKATDLQFGVYYYTLFSLLGETPEYSQLHHEALKKYSEIYPQLETPLSALKNYTISCPAEYHKLMFTCARNVLRKVGRDASYVAIQRLSLINFNTLASDDCYDNLLSVCNDGLEMFADADDLLVDLIANEVLSIFDVLRCI
jgi:hypothetical protein